MDGSLERGVEAGDLMSTSVMLNSKVVQRPLDRHRQILEIAARVICEKSYEGASIHDISKACGLTKGGLYHHIRSKEHLLVEIMRYGMDMFEERVTLRTASITDPLQRLRATMECNIRLVTDSRTKEVTIILHEHNTLTGAGRAEINRRKKSYVQFLVQAFSQAMERHQIRPVNPKVAAFSLLGTVLWTYKWFRSDGEISEDQLVEEMIDQFFGGLEILPSVQR